MQELIVFVKYPTPGQVKTRLGSVIGFEPAAHLYTAFMRQTFDLARKSAADSTVVACAPAERLEDFRQYVPDSFSRVAQTSGDLGARMLTCFEESRSRGALRTVIIGSDSPTLPVERVDAAFEALNDFDMVVGPAEDGGYYLIGMQRPLPEAFERIEWSSETVLQNTVRRARDSGIRLHLLKSWYDVDDLTSLRKAARDDQKGEIATFLRQNALLE